jgi:curved DNA-binding protein
MSKDLYEILDVSRNASQDDIKKSFRRLARIHHPDVNKGDAKAEERFKEVSQAYDVLSDPEKRKKYDQLGAQWEQAGPGGGTRYNWSSGDEQYDVGDLGRDFGFDFGEVFGDIFGGGFQGRSQHRRSSPGRQGPQYYEERPKDLFYSMDIDFLQSVKGTTAKIAVMRHGKREQLSVKIPAGVKTGSKIRLSGKGEQDSRGQAGDLFISLNVKPHKVFWREREDIYIEQAISMVEAALGCRLEVPTIGSPVKLTIPPGTSSGQKFRLKEKGVDPAKGKSKGDQYVLIKIETPQELDEASKKLLIELAKLNPSMMRS